MNNRVAYLVSKKLSGEISEAESRELNDCLIAEPGLHDTISLLEIAWQGNNPQQGDLPDVMGLLVKLRLADGSFPIVPITEHKKPEKSLRTRGFWVKSAGAAAAIILLLLAVWWAWLTPNKQVTLRNERTAGQVTTKRGSRSQLVLRDGSKVWLNADSKLTYANDFDGKTREIYLSGEAFFDVVSNPDRPFIIHANKITIKVTGTTFNVRDYPGEAKAITSLLTGKVEVVPRANPEKVYYLKPNEKITLSEVAFSGKQPESRVSTNLDGAPVNIKTEISPLQVDPVENILPETAWVNDRLVFTKESFRDIADKMEKWYDVKIVFLNKGLEDELLNGSFGEETLDEALTYLQLTTPFSFERKDKVITIFKKKTKNARL